MGLTSTPAINSFKSEYSFLSNFYPVRIEYKGNLYLTLEHAMQAAKTTNDRDRRFVNQNCNPAEAKKRGRLIKLRPDWEAVKLDVVRDLLRIKFAPGSKLASKLLATGDAELVEGNKHGDTFWGVCRGVGLNWLGVLLMQIRSELRS